MIASAAASSAGGEPGAGAAGAQVGRVAAGGFLGQQHPHEFGVVPALRPRCRDELEQVAADVGQLQPAGELDSLVDEDWPIARAAAGHRREVKGSQVQILSARRGERGRHSIIEYRFRRFHQRKQRRTRSSCRRRDQGRDRRGRAPWDLLGDQVKIDRSLTACTCAKNIDARSRRWAPRRAERTASSHGCGSLTRSDDCCTISLVSWPSARPLVIVVAMLDRGSSELACGSRRRRPSHDGLDSLLAHRRRQDLRRQAQRQAAVGGQFRTRDERTTGGGEEDHRPRDLRRRATATEGRRRAGRRVRRPPDAPIVQGSPSVLRLKSGPQV